MDSKAGLSASMEDYLETIFWITEKSQVARVKDIAETLSVSMPSVTGALKTLAAKDLVNYDPYQYITLTERGKEIAQEIARHHEVLVDFLVRLLHLPKDKAEENACRMEHVIDEDVFKRLIQYLEFSEACPRREVVWTEDAGYLCRVLDTEVSCEQCEKAMRPPSNEAPAPAEV